MKLLFFSHMFDKYFFKNLKAEEEVIKLQRQYHLTYAWCYLISFSVILLVFFFLFPLFRLGWWGVLIFILLLTAAILFILRTFIMWSLNAILITNKRVIDFDQRGVFHKNVSEITFDNIADISYNTKGILPTLFKYGNVKVKTTSVDNNLELKKVHYPDEMQELLVDCQLKYKKSNQSLNDTEE